MAAASPVIVVVVRFPFFCLKIFLSAFVGLPLNDVLEVDVIQSAVEVSALISDSSWVLFSAAPIQYSASSLTHPANSLVSLNFISLEKIAPYAKHLLDRLVVFAA